MKKEYFIFAGVNGAGKSTLYNLYPDIPKNRINSDEILIENGGNWRSSTDQAYAMKEAVKRINDYFNRGISFNQETTLAGNSIINNIKKAKEQGYYVKVCYVGLKSADLAIQRVQQRVEKGGHGIAEEDIRRRYEQSLKNLQKIIPICDKVEIYDNTEKFFLASSYVNGELEFQNECKWLDNINGKNEKETLNEKQETMNMSSWRKAVEKSNNSIRAASAEKQIDNSMDIGGRE